MKKTMIAAAAASLALLTGCSGESVEASSPEPDVTATASPEPEFEPDYAEVREQMIEFYPEDWQSTNVSGVKDAADNVCDGLKRETKTEVANRLADGGLPVEQMIAFVGFSEDYVCPQ